jgi:hypothetical protein
MKQRVIFLSVIILFSTLAVGCGRSSNSKLFQGGPRFDTLAQGADAYFEYIDSNSGNVLNQVQLIHVGDGNFDFKSIVVMTQFPQEMTAFRFVVMDTSGQRAPKLVDSNLPLAALYDGGVVELVNTIPEGYDYGVFEGNDGSMLDTASFIAGGYLDFQ